MDMHKLFCCSKSAGNHDDKVACMVRAIGSPVVANVVFVASDVWTFNSILTGGVQICDIDAGH